MRKKIDQQDQRALVRRALQEATGPTEPDLGRVRDALPTLMQRAAMVRAARSRAALFVALGMMARKALPRLATAALLLLLAAATVGMRDRPDGQPASSQVDRLILTGRIDSSTSDILLDGLTREEANNG